MEIIARLTECKEVLAKAYELNESDSISQFSTYIKNQFSAGDAVIDLELMFRCHLDDLINNCGNNIIRGSDIERLIRFAFDFGHNCLHEFPLFGRVPSMLIEDLLESQTIDNCEEAWSIVESFQDMITHSDFTKGKLTILKACNSLLRKLSKSCNAEFCGRILLFLAAVYPISDKSAVNLSGKINSGNVTYFETAEQFDASELEVATTVSGCSAGEEEANNGAAGTVMEVAEEEGEVAAAAARSVQYELYSSFWRLQSFLAAEGKVVDRPGVWRDFAATARRTLDLLDASDATAAEGKNVRISDSSKAASKGRSSRSRKAAALSAAGKVAMVVTDEEEEDEEARENRAAARGGGCYSGDAYMGCKFLTSSQLFSLQLRDPVLRQQVAVQLLYFIHYVRSKAPLPPSLVAEGLQVSEVSQDLLHIHDRASAVLESSCGRQGRALVEVVRRLLSRESHFQAWKAAGCASFEKKPLPLGPSVVTPTVSVAEEQQQQEAVEAESSSRKRKAEDRAALEAKVTSGAYKRTAPVPSSSAGKRGKGPPQALPCPVYEFDCGEENVQAQARSLAECVPDYAQKLGEYLEAEDPECGIDDDYHPKHDNIYCWRTRRLLAANALFAFGAMGDGDIGKGLRKLQGLNPEPPALVAAAVTPPSAATVTGDDSAQPAQSGGLDACVLPSEEEAKEVHMDTTADGDGGGVGTAQEEEEDAAPVARVSVEEDEDEGDQASTAVAEASREEEEEGAGAAAQDRGISSATSAEAPVAVALSAVADDSNQNSADVAATVLTAVEDQSYETGCTEVSIASVQAAAGSDSSGEGGSSEGAPMEMDEQEKGEEEHVVAIVDGERN